MSLAELDERFLGVFDDLRDRFEKNGRHNLVSTSQQLRYLFFDRPSLVTAVKDKHGLEAKFEIIPPQHLPKPLSIARAVLRNTALTPLTCPNKEIQGHLKS